MKELKELTWENFRHLQNKINSINKNLELSSLFLLTWKYYGTTIYFYEQENVIYLFGNACLKNDMDEETKHIFHENNNSRCKHIILCPIVSNYENIDFYIKESISIFKENFGNEDIYYENFLGNDELIKNKIVEWNISYIYETEKLKTFSGKKLQKKRNNLNNFIKNNSEKIKFIKYSSEHKEEFINFCNQEINSSFLSNSNERKIYKDILDNLFENETYASMLYIDNKLEGVTLGIINNDFFEIFIERCNKDIRGAYQYLLSNNLIINNINTKYVNRQDDALLENIKKSKNSYYPIYVKKSKLVAIDKNKIN